MDSLLLYFTTLLCVLNHRIVQTQFTELSLYTTCNNTNVLCWGLKRSGNAYTDCIYGGNCDLMVAIFEDKSTSKSSKTGKTKTSNTKERVRFQLMGKPWDDATGITHGGYIAVGISFDGYMGDDSVTECVCTDTKGSKGYRVFASYNTPEKINIRENTSPYIQSNWVLVQDGTVLCDFYRDAKTIVNQNTFDLTTNNQKYHILLAMGKLEGTEEESTKLGYHSFDSRLGSPEPILYRDKIVSHLPAVGARKSGVSKIVDLFSLKVFALLVNQMLYNF